MRSYIATAMVLAMICPAHAGGDESTWTAPKKAIMHHKPVRVITPPAVVPTAPAPVTALPVGVVAIALADLPKLCADQEIFAANPNWYYQACYIPPFADSSENPNRDSSSPN